MTQIAATDSALVRLIEGCDFPGVTVMSAPHEWDGGFVQRLIDATPAILIAFLGADEPDSRLTELNLDGRWAAYVCVGWNGQDQKARRLGAGAGFDLMHRAASVLHTAILTEPDGSRLPQVNVDGLGVEADSALDLANLWIGSIALTVELPLALDPGERCYGPLDDFLRVRGDIEVPGPADDLPVSIDLPQ